MQLVINDPKVEEKDIFSALITNQDDFKSKIIFEKDITKAIENTDAVLIMTEWDEYKNLDWEKLQYKMRNPCWVFDTRSIISDLIIKKTSINFWQLGNGQFS